MANGKIGRAHRYRGRASAPITNCASRLYVANRLIFKHGYLRRKEELEDTESVTLGKPKD